MRFLDRLGEQRTLGSDRPFLLREDAAWLVRSGYVDVFSTPLGDRGEPAGRRRHLFRLGPHQLALGVRPRGGGRPVGLLAVGTNGARVTVLGRPGIEKLMRERPQELDIASLLDGWIDLVSASLGSGGFPDDCQELDAGAYDVAEKALRIRPKDRPLWIRHEGDRSLLLGGRALQQNGAAPTPVSPHAWLEVPDGSRVVAEPTAEVAARHEVWPGLDQLHELLLDSIVDGNAALARVERERLRDRAAADRRAFIGACADIAETLDAASPLGEAGETSPAQQESAILLACRLVGDAMGTRVVPPPPAQEGSMREPIAVIARASRFRIRQVMLKGDWWRTDGGPFVGFRKGQDQERPVALLRSVKGYVLHDPLARTQQPVTEAVSEELEPLAYTFYRPMPDQRIGAFDLIRFGLAGCHRDLTSVLILSAIIGLVGLVPPIAIRTIFNDVIPSADRSALLQLTFGVMVAALATGLLTLARSRSIVRIEGRMGTTLQSGVWDRLLSVPMPFFRPFTAGELAHRTLSMEAIRRIVSGPVLTSLLAGFFSLLQLVLLYDYNARLARWATLVIAVTITAICLVAWAQMDPERSVVHIRSRLGGTLLQILSSIGKLRVAGAEVHAFAMWARRFSRQRRFQLRSRTLMNALSTFNAGIPVLGNLVIFALAARMLIEGEGLRTGDFLGFISAFSLALTGVLQATNGVIATMKIVPAYEQAVPILETLPEVDASKADPGKLQGDIEIRHLSFRYQTDGPLILRDVGFRVRPGAFVALVGPSGSGKSTLLRLLLGFEAPGSGAIYYDGQELAGLDHQAVRSQIGTVLQNGRLTSGDLFTNIVGSSRATLDDAWEAARMAGLDEDIESMPMGMHTVLNEGASTLSGGQRQRLLIARALVNKPKIVFFDEATSALDNRTQALVTQSLDAIQATRIVVAHRLSTIENADKIHVLDRGQIVESGTTEALIAEDGLFAALARRQMT